MFRFPPAGMAEVYFTATYSTASRDGSRDMPCSCIQEQGKGAVVCGGRGAPVILFGEALSGQPSRVRGDCCRRPRSRAHNVAVRLPVDLGRERVRPLYAVRDSSEGRVASMAGLHLEHGLEPLNYASTHASTPHHHHRDDVLLLQCSPRRRVEAKLFTMHMCYAHSHMGSCDSSASYNHM